MTGHLLGHEDNTTSSLSPPSPIVGVETDGLTCTILCSVEALVETEKARSQLRTYVSTPYSTSFFYSVPFRALLYVCNTHNLCLAPQSESHGSCCMSCLASPQSPSTWALAPFA